MNSTFFCTDDQFAAWKASCPKKNKEKKNFCKDNCLVVSCSSDDNCKPVPVAPVEPVEPKKLCWKKCVECLEDSECEALKDFVAPKGDKNCTSSASALGFSFVLVALAVLAIF